MPKHEIDPVFDSESRVLIAGSFPSPKSREQGFYYAHPQNRMWKILSRIFAEPFPETPEERKAFLLRNRIAMWDVLESCEINGASDTSIRKAVPNDFRRILDASRVRVIFTAGAKASDLYDKFQGKDLNVLHIALPSTSPANAAASEDYLAAAYLPVRLFTLQDLQYRDFFSGLVPNVDKETVIGIRTPEMRRVCRQLNRDTALSQAFFRMLPHRFYEENGLHSFFIEQLKDYDECIDRLDQFLPYVNNWATCDSMKPQIFTKNRDRLIKKIPEWLASDDVYAVRFGIEMLMTHFLDEDFDPAYLQMAAAICPAGQDAEERDYYVRMMAAWYFATALTKQYDAALPYVEKHLLSDWVHATTIRKARESRLVPPERKEYLKTLR